MKYAIIKQTIFILLATKCFAGDCDNPPTPGPCQELDEDCNVVYACDDDECCYEDGCASARCFVLVPHIYICGDTGGACPDCDSVGCDENVECLINVYYEAVPGCSGGSSWTAAVLAAKTVATCIGEWDYAAIRTAAIKLGITGVACATCTGWVGCSPCVGAILLALNDPVGLCDFVEGCYDDDSDEPETKYIVSHVLTGSCP